MIVQGKYLLVTESYWWKTVFSSNLSRWCNQLYHGDIWLLLIEGLILSYFRYYTKRADSDVVWKVGYPTYMPDLQLHDVRSRRAINIFISHLGMGIGVLKTRVSPA